MHVISELQTKYNRQQLVLVVDPAARSDLRLRPFDLWEVTPVVVGGLWINGIVSQIWTLEQIDKDGKPCSDQE